MDARWELIDVYDGDSFHVHGYLSVTVPIDIPGYAGQTITAGHTVTEMVRLAHVNASEMGTPQGTQARDAVRHWMDPYLRGLALPLVPYGRDKYKRLLADVITPVGKLSDFVLQLTGTVPMELRRALAED